MNNIQSQKNIQKIPRLRFPEFSGKWEEKKLKDYLHEHKTRNINNEYTEVFSVAKEKGVINQIEHLGRSYSAESLINYKVIFPDDIVYTKSPTANFPYGIIKQNRTERSGVVSTLYAVYKPKNKYIGYLIHEYFLSWVHTYNYLVPLVQKGAKNTINIGNSEFLNGSILYLPSIEKEQQKIVSFLKISDEWTSILRKQKESLEEYKKGIMQKIFSQEIRFKDDNGKNFPKWEEKKLGEILKERKEYSTKGKGYPHISLTTQGVVPKSKRYNRDFLVGDDEVKGYKITRLNDLCYNPANLKFGVISINKLGAGIFSPIYVTFEIIGQNIDFVGYYLIRDEFINKARRYEQGTVYERMAVSPADFVKVKVAFPSLPEQQKIADFLTSLDKAIEAKQQQITLAENWRKGLTQGLFI
jgi:type I restriction enzyme S subunit